jgi:high-affinity iron transporter
MLATLIIVFRELIEAGLIVGIIMAATREVPNRGRWIVGGILAGILGSGLVALFADSISNAMEGVGQELFNASVLAVAVLMLTWHNVWMARHGRAMASEMKTVGAAVADGRRSLAALVIVIGLAVLREGSEVVLYGVAISGGESVAAMMTGGALGLILGAGMSTMMYLGLLRMPTRYLFSVTSWLITLLAAGMAAQAVTFFQQAGVIEILTQTVWDTSGVLPNSSITGKVLQALVGYVDRPNQLQLIAYATTLMVIFGLMRLFRPEPAVRGV